MRAISLLVPTALALALAACQQAQTGQPTTDAVAATSTPGKTDAELIAHGDYLARIAGCHDCHTPGYAGNSGKAPREAWLVGSPLGWNGPWGTTYPANLRLKVADMDDKAWLDYSAKLHTRPPMPDFAVRDMTEEDRLALFRFIKSLGPGGEPVPAYLPPGEVPPMPYVEFKLPPPPATAATATRPEAG